MQEAEDWALTVAVTGSLRLDLQSLLPLVRKVNFTTGSPADLGIWPRGSFLKDHWPCPALHQQVWALLQSQEGYWQVQGPWRSLGTGASCGGGGRMAVWGHNGQGEGQVKLLEGNT